MVPNDTDLSSNTTSCNENPTGMTHFNIYFIYIILILYIIIFVFGTIGNLLTCLAVFIHKSMRRSIHVYMVNLAVADMIILLLFVPIESLLLLNNLTWNMGQHVCMLTNILNPMCVTCSIATLTAISVDRYSGVRDPFAWRIKSTRNAKVVVPLTWILSTCAALPWFMFGGLNRTSDGACVCMWPGSVVKTWYMFVTMVLQYIFPFLLIASLSAHIIWIIARGRESINKLHRRMVKMVTLMLVTYLVCDGMPYVHFYYELYHGSSTGSSSKNEPLDNPHDDQYAAYVYVFSNLLLTLQAALNPLIYSSIRDDFNLAFKTLISACGFTLTSIIVPGHDISSEPLDTRKISRTDTERMYLNSLDRERRISQYRMKSTENMAIHGVAPETRKVSIYQAARKHSLREFRKQSVVRERSLVTTSPVAEGVEENNFTDNDGDKPVTFRSYRLGTLEFLELEKFHERMKSEIRKESRVKKISRMFHQYQRNKQHSPGRKEDPHHTSTPDLTRLTVEKNRQSSLKSSNGKSIIKSQSFDSLASSGSLIKRSSRRPQASGEKLVRDTLLPLTFVVGKVSQNSAGKNSLTVGETSQNSSGKNSLGVGGTSQSSSKKNSVVGFSSAPNSRGRSRASTPDADETLDSQTLPKNSNHLEDLSVKVLAKHSRDDLTAEKNGIKNPPLRPPFNLLQTSSEYQTTDLSNRKLSLDSVIKKIKETYPNECVLSVNKPQSRPISPKKRRRKKPIQSLPLMETGRKLSQNIADCIRHTNPHGTINKLGRKYSHEVTIENPHTPYTDIESSKFIPSYAPKQNTTEKKLNSPCPERKQSVIGAAMRRIVNVVGKEKHPPKNNDFKISIRRSPSPTPDKCTINISSNALDDPGSLQDSSPRISFYEGTHEERGEEVHEQLPIPRPTRKISVHEQKSYKDMLSRNQQFNLRFTPVLTPSQENVDPCASDLVKDYNISIRNDDLIKFLHAKESTC